MSDASSKPASISFFQRNPIQCPICDASIYREEMLTGRGRLNAGNLTLEFRRLYESSKKYGEVSPLIYPITVCPDCYYAAWQGHFTKVPPSGIQKLADERDTRISTLESLLGGVNFSEPRTLREGLASYYLALNCYDVFTKEFAPVMHQGIWAVRAAWLCNDLERHFPGENYAYLGRMFYRKARFFYRLALEYEQKGVQTIANCPSLGPDTDHNFGYDGVVYLTGYLEFHFGPRENPEIRQQNLKKAKQMVARIFGMGKASKNKPAAMLDNARSLYNQIAAALGQQNANPEEDAKADD